MGAVAKDVAAAELTEVADGVLAYVQPDGGWCLNNTGAVHAGGEVLVVDTAATEARTRRFRELLVSGAGAPRVVVNTHFHGDHTFGNFIFTPESTIIAHENARTESEMADLGMRHLWPWVDWGEIRLVLANTTYRERASVHLGTLRVELHHPGPAHTTGDTVVWVPERRVLFAGDIVMSGVTPFCLMGSISGTLRTLTWLRSLGAERIISGHGSVAGPEAFDVTEDYLRWTMRLAEQGRDRGHTPLQVAESARLGRFGELLDSERLVGNLHRAYAELGGAPEGAELDVLTIFEEMVTLHGGPLPCFA